MKDKMEMLDRWLKDICPGTMDNFVKIVEDSRPVEGLSRDPIKRKKIISIFTNDHKYHIVAIDREKDKSYLGCQASTRKPRAGEDWQRGNDLPDGPFNRRTWVKILNGIIKYELIRLAPQVGYMVDTPEVGPSLGEESEDKVEVGL